jgi:hypothetical protein
MSAVGFEFSRRGLEGHDLKPTVGPITDEPPAPRPVFSELNVAASETYEHVELRAAWLGDVKCIENPGGADQFGRSQPQWFGFDLSSDPLELGVIQGGDDRLEACRYVLAAWEERIESSLPGEPGAESTVSEETTDMLRALGYIR